MYYVCRCYLRPENKYVSETKYLKYQQNIEGNSSLECENVKIFSFKNQFLVFCQYNVVQVILAPYHKYLNETALIVYVMYADVFWVLKICFWGARSLRPLAQYKHVFFCQYIWGSCPPPSQYLKPGYATGEADYSMRTTQNGCAFFQ